MQEIIKEYGPAMIAATAIIAIAGLITALFYGDDSMIGTQFSEMISQFFDMASSAGKTIVEEVDPPTGMGVLF